MEMVNKNGGCIAIKLLWNSQHINYNIFHHIACVQTIYI